MHFDTFFDIYRECELFVFIINPLSSTADRKGLTMTGSVFILGGNLILILAAAWWVLHP